MLTTSYVPGTPNWVDLGSTDIEASAAFYGAVLGWEFRSAGPHSGGYGMFTLDGKTVAAIGPLTEEGASPAWTLYFQTDDADAIAKAVEQAGGTVRLAPDDVMDKGRMAGFTDPTGAQFAVWQPGRADGGLGGLDVVTDPGTLCWTELHTTDPAAAKTFYRAVFGWTTEDLPMGDFSYTVVRPAGQEEGTDQGGIMGIDAEMASAGMTSRWQPYFEVTDCDTVAATAAERGATLLMPPEDLAGVGRMCAMLDPSGAAFSVITSVSA